MWRHDPLYEAVYCGDVDKMNNLLTQYVGAGQLMNYDFSPLHYAVVLGRKELFHFLIAGGYAVNVRTRHKGETPAHWAATFGQVNMLVKLDKLGCDLKAQNQTDHGHGLIHLAAIHDKKEVVDYLLSRGLYVDMINDAGMTPLFLAVQYTNPRLVKHLITKGASVNYRTKQSVTPLHLATQLNTEDSDDIVKFLIDGGADVNIFCELYSFTPIHWAAKLGKVTTLEAINRHAYLSLKTRDDNGYRPIDLAAMNGHAHLVRWLWKHRVLAKITDEQKFSALHHAIYNNHYNVVVALLEAEVNVNERMDCFDHNTPLHIAVQTENAGIIELLLKNSALANIENAEKRTPMHLAIERDQLGWLQMMVSSGGDVHINEEGRHGETLLITAVKCDNRSVIEWLINEQVALDVKDGRSLTPLHHAADCDSLDAAKVLLQERVRIDATAELDCGRTPLHYAVMRGSTQMVELLCEEGADLYSRTEGEGLTPLHVAAEHGQLGCLQVMLFYGGISCYPAKYMGDHLIHTAARSGQSEVVEWLISLGNSVNKRNEYQETPLAIAAAQGCVDTVRLLLAKQANINICNLPSNRTALHCAVEKSRMDVVKLLVTSGADRSIKDWLGLTAADLVAPDKRKDLKVII
ncbi:ankyrin-1-like [Periplaneta americana]|uniref:ankyrin-1-like n=1 Tax=Periplaneta americana TaxID=6978 RepID=UPI0037E80C63